MQNPPTIDWYFDFISPFAYLQLHALTKAQQQRPALQINYHPVLLAGLLQQHAQKGPAEIPAKRQMIYRYCHWYANKNNIAFNTPAAHPFNPLALLRVAIAHNCERQVIAELFEHVWVHSAEHADFYTPQAIAKIPSFDNADELIANPAIKQRLKQNTEQALALGMFGVPTIVTAKQMFWGADMTEMALDFVDHPDLFCDDDYIRIEQLPVAATRA